MLKWRVSCQHLSNCLFINISFWPPKSGLFSDSQEIIQHTRYDSIMKRAQNVALSATYIYEWKEYKYRRVVNKLLWKLNANCLHWVTSGTYFPFSQLMNHFNFTTHEFRQVFQMHLVTELYTCVMYVMPYIRERKGWSTRYNFIIWSNVQKW